MTTQPTYPHIEVVVKWPNNGIITVCAAFSNLQEKEAFASRDRALGHGATSAKVFQIFRKEIIC